MIGLAARWSLGVGLLTTWFLDHFISQFIVSHIFLDFMMKILHKWIVENEINNIHPLKWDCFFFCQVVIVKYLVNFVRSTSVFGFCCYHLCIETSNYFSLGQLVPCTECGIWSFKEGLAFVLILNFHWSMNMHMPQKISLYMSFYPSANEW